MESPLPIRRYVAIGDSSTEGLDDPDGRGNYHGWANRLAENLDGLYPGLLYANLGIRGRRTRQIRDEQLAPALAMRPDLVSFFSGTNDVVAKNFDVDAVAADIEAVHQAVRHSGARLLTFTLPDLTPVMPAARRIAPRIEALGEAIREISAKSGAILIDFARHPVASDPRLWSEDRLHANSAGHARIAAALAHALLLPGSGPGWADPLPPMPAPRLRQKAAAEIAWARKFLLPWMWRHLRGRSTGDGILPKRPELAPVSLHPPR